MGTVNGWGTAKNSPNEKSANVLFSARSGQIAGRAIRHARRATARHDGAPAPMPRLPGYDVAGTGWPPTTPHDQHGRSAKGHGGAGSHRCAGAAKYALPPDSLRLLLLRTALSRRVLPVCYVQVLQNQLDAVRQLPRLMDKLEQAREELDADVSLPENRKEPTFRRLFTHGTWDLYTGGCAWRRWLMCLTGWRRSSVLRAIWPSVASLSAWALMVSLLCPRGFAAAIGMRFPSALLAPSMGLMLSLQGAAIGLILVFRTNNAYARLDEARMMWGNLIYLSREVVSKAVVALDYPVVCEVRAARSHTLRARCIRLAPLTHAPPPLPCTGVSVPVRADMEPSRQPTLVQGARRHPDDSAHRG